MNIYLIPYTPFRHLVVGFACMGFCLAAWWMVLSVTWLWAPWPVEWDGPLFLGAISAAAGGGSVLAEGSLRRSVLWKRALLALLATLVAALVSIGAYWCWALVSSRMLASLGTEEDVLDPSLVSLRYRWISWMTAGFGAGLGTALVRKLRGGMAHMVGGALAGLAGAAVWFAVGYPKFAFTQDLFYAAALGSASFGLFFGIFTWGVPDDLYAGWVRVLTVTRHGRRIPVDGLDGGGRERFIGHFPRGLDLFLPADDGVLELHASVLVNKKQEYRLRGLTLSPTVVKRFLESVDLSYDPARPAPLETRLSSGDRVVMGAKGKQTVVEFIMLPREER